MYYVSVVGEVSMCKDLGSTSTKRGRVRVWGKMGRCLERAHVSGKGRVIIEKNCKLHVEK